MALVNFSLEMETRDDEFWCTRPYSKIFLRPIKS